MFRARAVLPMLGRAAMIIRSLFWKPAVRLSRSLKPLVTPVIRPFSRCQMASRLAISFSTRADKGWKPRRTLDSATSKTFCSAASRNSATFSTLPKQEPAISWVVSSRRRRIAPAVEVNHGLKDSAVGLPIKVAGSDHIGHPVQHLRAHQDGPQDRLLRLRIGRRGKAAGVGGFRRGRG